MYNCIETKVSEPTAYTGTFQYIGPVYWYYISISLQQLSVSRVRHKLTIIKPVPMQIYFKGRLKSNRVFALSNLDDIRYHFVNHFQKKKHQQK